MKLLRRHPARSHLAPSPLRRLVPALLVSALLVPALLVPALMSGCGGPGGKSARQGPPRHVFLITVDTLRADHLTPYGYARDTSPTLAELAGRSVLFERAIAQWPKTGPSFASAFTGQYPQTTGLTHKAALRLPDGYLTLPELMAEVGYTPLAVVSNGVLGKRLGWDQGFREYLQTWDLAPEPSDDPVEYRKWLNARRVNELALPMLERHREAERLFVWLHYSDPHAPYLLPEDVENPFVGDAYYVGDELVKLDGRRRATALGDHRELRYYVAAYDGNVRFTDEHIGGVLRRARELGLLEDALVVFTADHGESLGQHGYYFGHGRLPYNDGAHVPLMLSWPGRLGRGERLAAPVELVDLYPTLRDLVAPGQEVPGLEGESWLPLLDGSPAARRKAVESFRLAFSQAGGGSPTTHFRSVQDPGWKLIYHPPLKMDQATRPRSLELYDLARDPGETRNLVEEEPRQRQRLWAELEGWMKGSEWIRRDREDIETQSEETLRALKALGYVN